MTTKTKIGVSSTAGAGAIGGGAYYASTLGGSDGTGLPKYNISSLIDTSSDNLSTTFDLKTQDIPNQVTDTTKNPYGFGTFVCAKKYFDDKLSTLLKHDISTT